ncbi:basic helix-loop-helix ARNT-like protein 2 [Rhodnius prolixus]|uniref:PAS domain-containing protein n=1 Tax=Rhodnius prolixus TaxID=13249 RepID=T1IEG1_RHOPR
MENVQVDSKIIEAHNENSNRKRDKLGILTDSKEILVEKNKLTTNLPIVINNNNISNPKAVSEPIRDNLGINTNSGILAELKLFNDHDLKLLINDADGFLFIARCDNGRIIYVSDTIMKILYIRQDEWVNTTLFAQIHPADVNKVKEQFVIKLGDQEKAIVQERDNIRRTFTCRMKLRPLNGRGKYKHLPNIKNNLCYAAVHCNGYIRQCPVIRTEQESEESKEDGRSPNEDRYCFVGHIKLQQTTSSVPNNVELDTFIQQFTSRHSFCGNFIFVDERVTAALGYTTAELLGKSFFDFFYRDDCRFIKETFKFIPSLKGKSMTVTYRFWSKSGYWVWLRINIYAFVNPYNNEMEHIICDCTVLPHDVGASMDNRLQYFNMAFHRGGNRQKERSSQAESTILSTVADLATNDCGFLLPDPTFNAELYAEPIMNGRSTQYNDWTNAIPQFSDWTLPQVMELLPQQQENWPFWTETGNDVNPVLNTEQQPELWQFNEDNLWQKPYLDNIWPQQYSNIEFNRSKLNNWNDLENYSENFTYLPNSRSNLDDFNSNNQRLWYDDPQLWPQNLPQIAQNIDLNTMKSLNEIGQLSVTDTVKSNNLPWKFNDDNLQLTIPQQYTTLPRVDTTIKSTIISDQSKLLQRLPDLIEQVLHVDQPYRHGEQNEA